MSVSLDHMNTSLSEDPINTIIEQVKNIDLSDETNKNNKKEPLIKKKKVIKKITREKETKDKEQNIKQSNKKELGQFYTTNYEYILSGMNIPEYVKKIIEPFVGNGDLLGFIKNKTDYTIETYDIDPKYEKAIKQDTLNTPPDYTDKFVLTNPPYLARNKSKQKELYDKYNSNDLYKCFIISLVQTPCQAGIIIIPLNFISSIRKADIDLRKQFLKVYSINRINIFEEQVFEDTGYSICSIYFENKSLNKQTSIDIHIYPSKKQLFIELNSKNNYTIGGEIYNLPYNPAFKIQRATKEININISNILLKCIDDNINSQLGFQIVDDAHKFIDDTPKLSARSYASLIINKTLTIKEQTDLVDKMNKYIKTQREKYNSLFLTNYRESNTIARKRISFELAFRICNYILSSE